MDAISQYLLEEVEEESRLGYLNEEEKRRRIALLTGQTTGSGATLIRANASQDPEVTVPEGDGAIVSEHIEWGPAGARVRGYVARPKDRDKAPGVVVIHENKGLVPYIEDVARRLAKLGFVAIAPDLLSRAGGTQSFADPAEATAALGKIPREQFVEDLRASVDFLASAPFVENGRLGAIGFCFGGGMTWRLTTAEPRLLAAVPFYGPNPPMEDVAKIRAAVLAIYGGLDDRINAGIGDIEKAMAEHHKTFEKVIYPGAEHAFHNDTNPDRYHREAARAAWERATGWLDKYLK